MAMAYFTNFSIARDKYGLLTMLKALAAQELPGFPRGRHPGQAEPASGFCPGTLPVMVGFASDNGEGSVDLLYRYKPHHLVVKCELGERERMWALCFHLL